MMMWRASNQGAAPNQSAAAIGATTTKLDHGR